MKWLKKHQVGVAFSLLIGMGVLFCGLALRSKSSCPPKQQTTWQIQGNTYTARKNNPNKSEYIATQKENPNTHNYSPDQSYSDVLEVWFCEEAKISDLALVFLTYCLVVVGGIAMWALDRTSKRTERAYIQCGGPFGKRKVPPQDPYNNYFRTAFDFQKPWRMALHNFGKTPATIVHIHWGLCPQVDFPTDRRRTVTNVLKNPPPNAIICSKVVDESIAPNIPGQPYRHVEFDRKEFLGWIFFGRIDYVDVFGDRHHSTFKSLLEAEYTTPLPGAYSDDYD